jgi:serine/threonine-protein kinase
VDVALKTLPDFLVRKDPSFVKRFRKEAQLAAKIRDANVVCVFDVGRDKSVHFITMEHIDGLSAADLIEINGRLPLQAALVLVYGAALGLRAAWKLGIIHRDVKPSNIIVDKDGTAKISDLGVAKSLGDQSLGLTFTGATVGTPSYMAPEQNQDARVVDTRADI